VLDLFAGSGALGLEAISRGAGSVVFVDNDANAVMAIRRNAVRVIEEKERFRIMPMPAIRALRVLRGTFDIVLVDPPYDRGAREELATLMQRGLVATDGVAEGAQVCEVRRHHLDLCRCPARARIPAGGSRGRDPRRVEVAAAGAA
jgi:16S rRNA (guanine966-N2)-methyltransferase